MWNYHTGSMEYGLPTWGESLDGMTNWWHIPNFRNDGKLKLVYFEIENTTPSSPHPSSSLTQRQDWSTADLPIYNASTQSWMFQWRITIQPGWENVAWDATDDQVPPVVPQPAGHQAH